MKKLIFTTALLITLFITHSCSDDFGTNHRYEWKVKVTYGNGDVDTLHYNFDSFKGNECYTYLKIDEKSFYSVSGTEPCLVVGCGFRYQTIACGVRKFDVLYLNKIRIN